MSIKDLFDKEKGVLHKAEKRLARAEEERESKGDRRTGDDLEKVMVFLDNNHQHFDKLKGDLSRVYTQLGLRLESVGHDASAVRSYDKALELDDENFDALNAKGGFLLEGKMSEGALELFDRALALSPSHAITRFNRVRSLLDLDRGDEAERDLRSLVDDEPRNLEYLDELIGLVGDDVDLLKRKAELHRDRSEVEEADEALNRALEREPGRRDLWVLKADLFADRGDDRSQAEALEAAIAAGDKGPDPTLLRRLGRTQMRMEHFGDALQSFDRGLDLDAKEPGLLHGRAEALHSLERLDEADRAYGKAIDAMGEDAGKDVLVSAARVKADLGLHEMAGELLDRAVALDPDDPSVLKGKADALSSAGDHAAALEALQDALKLDVNDLDGWVKIVETLKHLDDDAALARSARRVVELDSERREAWLTMADALGRLERPEEAVEAYDAALALRHEDPVTMAKRLEAVVATGDWDGAMASSDDLLALEREHPRALEVRSEALERQGLHEEAVRAADAVIKLNERNREAHMRKARSLKAMGELDSAAAALRATIRVDAGHDEAKRLLYQVLMAANHNDDALVVLDDMVGTAEEDKELWIAKGRVHLRLEQPELAKRAFSRALELGGVDAEVLALLGRTLAELDEHAEAMKVLERAIELSPDDPEVHLLSGKTLMAQGKHSLADVEFQRVLKLRPRDVDVLRLRKECLIQLERHDEIVKVCDEVLDLDPRDVECLVDQGNAYTAVAHLPQALRAYQRAADLEEGSIEILELVATTLKALDRPGHAAQGGRQARGGPPLLRGGHPRRPR